MEDNQQEVKDEIKLIPKSGRYLGFLLLEDMTVHLVESDAHE